MYDNMIVKKNFYIISVKKLDGKLMENYYSYDF